MTALLSNNFEQVAGMLTYAEQVALIQHYNGIASPTAPETDQLRFPAHLSWLRRTRDLTNNYAAWEVHRAAWNASPATWLSHTGASASRQAALARGENLYGGTGRSRDANYRAVMWNLPTNNKSGWRPVNLLFWSGSSGGVPALTSLSAGTKYYSAGTGYSAWGAACAAAVNADHPAGYRTIRIGEWPIRPKYTLSGGESVYALRDSEADGEWANLYQDEWVPAVQDIWTQFLTAFKNAGGVIDYLFLDAEYRDDRGQLPGASTYYALLTPKNVAAGNQFTCTWGSETFTVTAADTSAATLCTAIANAWNLLSSGTHPNMAACTALAVTNISTPYVRINHDQMSLGYGVNTALTPSATGGTATFKRTESKGLVFPHPNYPQNKTVYNAITQDPRLTDAYLAQEYLPARADMDNIATWSGLLHEPANRFDEQRFSSLRKAIAEAVFEPLYDAFPDAEFNDYEDMLKCGDIMPNRVGSSGCSYIGCGYSGGTHQSRNFYSGANTSNNTKSYCYRPSTGTTEEITRTSEVRFTVANPGTGAVFTLTLEGYAVSHTVTAGQTAAQVASALVTAWNNVTSGQNLYVARYDAAIVSGAVLRLYPAGSSQTWKHEIEEVVGSVTGTGTLTKEITGFGWFPRFLDEIAWRLGNMIAASSKPIMPWLLPRTDPGFSFFGSEQTKILHLACMLASDGYVYYWNGGNDYNANTNPTPGWGDDLFDEALTLAHTLTGGQVCTPLPMPIRDGYQSLVPFTQDYYVGGRIMRLTVNKDVTYRVNYQPLLAAIGNKTAEVGSALTFTASATDSDAGETLAYSLVGAPSGASINSSSGAFTWTPSSEQADQTFGFKVVVTDNGPDALSNFEYIEVFVAEEMDPAPNTPPVIDPISTQSASEHTLFTFTPAAEDPEDDTLTWSFGGSVPAGMTINPSTGQVSWTPNETHGGNSYSIPLVVTDDGTPNLSGSRSFTINVSETNTAPQIAAIPDQQATEGVQLSYQCAATDIDVPAQTLTFSLPGTPPSGASITSGGLFTWTPGGSQSGEYDISVRVTDNGAGSLTATTTMHVSVADVNRPPVLTTIGAQEVVVGQALNLQVEATDPDGDELTFSLDEPYPEGMAITTDGLLTWSPSAFQVGTGYAVTVRVTDDGTPNFSDAETFSVTVRSTAPVLDSIGDRSVAVNATLTFFLVATDPDGSDTPLMFSAEGLPAGSTLDSSTGLFQWRPNAGDVGQHTVTFYVTNGVLTDSETIVITVTDGVARPSRATKPAVNPAAGAWWRFKGTGALRG